VALQLGCQTWEGIAPSHSHLVKNALRMRPTESSSGSSRAEALDMQAAMNSGHEGSMCTIHAKAQQALSKLRMYAMMAVEALPARRCQSYRRSDRLVVHLRWTRPAPVGSSRTSTK